MSTAEQVRSRRVLADIAARLTGGKHVPATTVLCPNCGDAPHLCLCEGTPPPKRPAEATAVHRRVPANTEEELAAYLHACKALDTLDVEARRRFAWWYNAKVNARGAGE